MPAPVRVLYWFRTDLRLHSSPALHAALELSPEVLYPVWTWDPEYVFAHKVGGNRFKFLLESMHELSTALSACNPKTKLHVVRGAPQVVLPYLFKEWDISHLVYEKDTAGYAAIRDHQINELASQAGIEVLSILGHTLYDPELVVKANGGKATMSLASWHAAVKDLPTPKRPLPTPGEIPPPGDTGLTGIPLSRGASTKAFDLNLNERISEITCYDTITGPNGDFAIPTLAELGLPAATTMIRGGEQEALRRLTTFCMDVDRVASFSKPQTSPAEFDPPETSLLSPYLKFGCLGINELFWRVRDTISEWRASQRNDNVHESKQPENFEGQLLFREMYYAAEFAQGNNFGQLRGNSDCRFVDWHLQNQYTQDGTKIIPRPPGDPVAEQWFSAWKEGQTGFPWIDAIMRQLRQDGWIHHLARHSVACFLTRGQCYISWERGAEVFDEYLLDWDPCSNPGNWMWLSASAFYNMYYRVYGVKSFPMKYDKTGKLVRKFCPELAKFPDKYIYSPHLAPLDIQEKAGCIIGEDYPKPMLDEKAEKDRCMKRMKAAFSLKLRGSDEKVINGSAGGLLSGIVHKLETEDGGPQKRKNVRGGGGDKNKAGASTEAGGGAGKLDGYITRQKKRE